jgi:hypothetical protein
VDVAHPGVRLEGGIRRAPTPHLDRLPQPLGYVVGLILGISGKGEVQASDRLGRILATVAIMFNVINLAWSVLGIGLTFRG